MNASSLFYLNFGFLGRCPQINGRGRSPHRLRSTCIMFCDYTHSLPGGIPFRKENANEL
jgi:hypothetical protein